MFYTVTSRCGGGDGLKIVNISSRQWFALRVGFEIHYLGKRKRGWGLLWRYRVESTSTEWRQVLRYSPQNKISYLCSIDMNIHTSE